MKTQIYGNCSTCTILKNMLLGSDIPFDQMGDNIRLAEKLEHPSYPLVLVNGSLRRYSYIGDLLQNLKKEFKNA